MRSCGTRFEARTAAGAEEEIRLELQRICELMQLRRQPY
jgi:hypothetical protein